MKLNVLGVTISLIVATTMAPLTVVEMVLWAAVLSLLGGVASSLRRADGNWRVMIQYGMNTAVLGASMTMVAHVWAQGDPVKSWAVIGGCGILSLGGLGTIDWLTNLVKRKIEKQVEKDGDE